MTMIPDEWIWNQASEADLLGPLPCGCYRIAVIDFGHDCGTVPRTHPRLQLFEDPS